MDDGHAPPLVVANPLEAEAIKEATVPTTHATGKAMLTVLCVDVQSFFSEKIKMMKSYYQQQHVILSHILSNFVAHHRECTRAGSNRDGIDGNRRRRGDSRGDYGV